MAVTHPLDVARTRQAYGAVGKTSYHGTFHALCATASNGLPALYKGFSPTLIGMVPYAGRRIDINDKCYNCCHMFFTLLSTSVYGFSI